MFKKDELKIILNALKCYKAEALDEIDHSPKTATRVKNTIEEIECSLSLVTKKLKEKEIK